VSRIAYVNGRYVPHGQAVVHIEDRGFQLADGVYEVWAVMDGKLADAEGHFARLQRSLGELGIAEPMSRAALTFVLRETIRRNHVRNGLVYLQVTRGTARRDHAFPDPEVPPTVVVTAKSINRDAAEVRAGKGVGVVTTPENRWGRCDIKTVGLLPNVLARQTAKEAGGYEAWFVDEDGLVTEGAASNAWIVEATPGSSTRKARCAPAS
jgi:D-alanine transaminase